MLNSGEGTVYSQAHTGGEHYDRKFDDLAMAFCATERGGARIVQSGVEQCLCEMWEHFLTTSNISRSTQGFGASSRATACGLHFG